MLTQYLSPLIDCTLPKGHSLSLSLLQCQNPEPHIAHSSYSIHTYRIKAMGYNSLCWTCHMASRKKFNGFNQIRTIRTFKGHLEHSFHFMDEESRDAREDVSSLALGWLISGSGYPDIQTSTALTDCLQGTWFRAALPKDSTDWYVLEVHKAKWNNSFTENFSGPSINHLLQRL